MMRKRVPMHLVAAPDKFRGTASAPEVAGAIAAAAKRAGWTCDEAPMSDGGEGLLDALACLGGSLRSDRVRGPLGVPVEAQWRLSKTTAVIEMARASGLVLVGGARANDPLEASTFGTGELIAAAVAAGARRIIVGVGGSATTDGGQGCLEALGPRTRLAGVELIVACDVTTSFLDAPRVFSPQKGATSAQVAFLERRLTRLAQDYRVASGVDVTTLPGSGAAGGLAGGLASIGATLVGGFDLVADLVDLPSRVHAAELVMTGEGLLDEWSFQGKVVGGVVELAGQAGVDALVIAGDVAPEVARHVAAVSLVERVGRDRSLGATASAVAEVAFSELERRAKDRAKDFDERHHLGHY